MGAGIRKFTFDTVFAADGREMRAGSAERFSYRPEEVEQAKKEAYAAGEASAVAKAERAATAALEAIAASLRQVHDRLDGESSQLRRDAAALGLAGARAAAETALSRFPVEVVEALFAECVESLRAAPQIRVYAPQAAHETVAARLAERCAAAGLEGALSVEAGEGPARIEWGAGAAELDPDAALDKAREAAERWLAARDAETNQMNLFDRSSEQGVSDDV